MTLRKVPNMGGLRTVEPSETDSFVHKITL